MHDLYVGKALALYAWPPIQGFSQRHILAYGQETLSPTFTNSAGFPSSSYHLLQIEDREKHRQYDDQDEGAYQHH